jgi:hypothetical protein
MERAKLSAERKPDRPAEVIKLAFLGFMQTKGSWKKRVEARTNNVFSARNSLGAWALLFRHFAKSSGPFDIRIAGFSWGGWTALELAKDLVLRHDVWGFLGGSPPKLKISVLVLDPVGTARNPLPADLASHVDKIYNCYQTNGCFGDRCPLPSQLFKGQSIPGAINNDVTTEGRGGSNFVDAVPPDMTPDHVHLGHAGYGGHARTVSDQLDG